MKSKFRLGMHVKEGEVFSLLEAEIRAALIFPLAEPEKTPR